MTTDRVLVITGASSGIGAATARAAARAGFRLALAARSAEKLDALVGEIGADCAVAIPTDVTSWESQHAMAARAVERFGRIDAVLANAGRPGQPGGFANVDPEVLRSVLLVNVLGVALTVRATLPMLRQSRGHMLITGSVAGRRTLAGSMYSASKWAVTAIGYGLREELRGTGVRVTLIEPGMVETAFFDEPKPDALRPDDVARTVLFALDQPPHVDIHELMVLPTPPVTS
jgi:NADP-dependent 3-hydroxy acid dehydrogenase YdfG